MKKLLLSCFILSVVIAFTACKKKTSAPSNAARVMFVNGCAGAVAIDVAANSVNIAGATNVGFQKTSGYRTVTAGSGINIGASINAGGLITPLISSTVSMMANSNYSMFIGGIFTKPNIFITQDDMTTPTTGFSKIRFVNLSSDTLNENFYIGSVKIDSNVGYASYTPFRQVPVSATPVTVLLQDPAHPTKIAQLNNQTFASGKIYTIILTGTSTGTASSALTLLVIPNN